MKTLLDFFKFNSETKKIENLTFQSLVNLNKKKTSKRNNKQKEFEKTLKLI